MSFLPMLFFYIFLVDFWPNFEGPDPYENIYIWFRKVFDFSEKLLKKAPGDPKKEPKSPNYRENIATKRRNVEKK